MARYTGSVCRLCRREGEKLFLKGERCVSPKCALDRRSFGPGLHGQRRSKLSEYGVQLREKQKVKRIYGLLEGQFRGLFQKANRKKGITGENLLTLLECRLDTVVHRMGLAPSQRSSRQIIRHTHILVKGNRVNIPSFLVRKGDVIGIREASRKKEFVVRAMGGMPQHSFPSWLTFNVDDMKGLILDHPKREDITHEIQEQLIVELYSK